MNIAAVAIVIFTVSTAAQTPGETLGSVNVPRPVLANGLPLAPGTYTLRFAAKATEPVAGQTTEPPWIEFVQGDQVKGRDQPTVVTSDDTSVLKGPGPRPGSARIDLLKGNEYLRIWVNHKGTHYLIHLPLK